MRFERAWSTLLIDCATTAQSSPTLPPSTRSGTPDTVIVCALVMLVGGTGSLTA